MAEKSKRFRISWLYSGLPISVATGPVGTIVQLYLINLNGQSLGTIYGSLAAAIFNGISIPAALFWGVATDRIHNRRGIIALSYALTSIALVSFFFDRTTAGTIGRYGIISFLSVASATPLNLLIMETESKSRWAGAFAKLSMISSVGNVLGLVVSTIWTEVFPRELVILFVPMGAFAVSSSILALVTIKEPAFVLERETVALRQPSFISRLRANPVFFVTVPTPSDFKRAFRGITSTLTRGVPLFYISTILFYLSAGLYNTSFVPALHLFSVPDQEVFAVILAGMVVQTISFRYAAKLVGAHNLIATSVRGLLLRGWSYIGVAFAAVLLSGPAFALFVMIFYVLASGLAFAIYYTSANTMVFTSIKSKSAGSALGVYSAVVGIAAMGGSFASGFISVYSGYYVTFLVAGLMLLVAAIVIGRLPKPSSMDESALH